MAKVSLRFVPRQDPNHLISRLRDFMHAEFDTLGSPNTINVSGGPLLRGSLFGSFLVVECRPLM